MQILLLAQHVSGTTMPIIRSSRELYSGCCLWYFVLWFSSCWSGVELRVMCPVCRMLQHPANRTLNPEKLKSALKSMVGFLKSYFALLQFIEIIYITNKCNQKVICLSFIPFVRLFMRNIQTAVSPDPLKIGHMCI